MEIPRDLQNMDHSTLQYAVVGHRPDGRIEFWTGSGFSEDPKMAMIYRDVEVASLTGKLEQDSRPSWQVNLRISEAA